MSARYVVRPKADEDLDHQAYYLATQANPEVGHRFLLAARETVGGVYVASYVCACWRSCALDIGEGFLGRPGAAGPAVTGTPPPASL